MDIVAPQFVLWAAEHIRSRFDGGQLEWKFVLSPLGLPPDDHDLGRYLAKLGLRWWQRKIGQSDTGRSMFLYTLLAEGGIPDVLLKEPGVYRNTVTGLLAEIEAEGGSADEQWIEQIALRWRHRLPQTFQSTDFTILLADLALSLAKLRALLPKDLPEVGADQWLDKHRPDWGSSIPQRMAPEIVKSLIRTERNIVPAAGKPLCVRELRRGENGSWQGYLCFHDNAWLDGRYFTDASDLRLRLLPTGSGVAEGVAYIATPENQGWQLWRLGKGGKKSIPLKPDVPFAFSAFADGKAKGEAVIDAGIPHPSEIPSFWRPAELSDGASTCRLTPLTGAARTRGPYLWALTPENEEPEASDGLTLDKTEIAPGGLLRRMSGMGTLHVGEKRYRIRTGAEEDAPEARLLAFGESLRGWRIGGATPVYRENVEVRGQLETGPFIQIPESELRRVPGRDLCSEIIEWMQRDEVLARRRLVRIPKSMSLTLREVSAGRIALSANGLVPGWRIRLSAGESESAPVGVLQDSTNKLMLDTSGKAPGLVRLRLSDPTTGRALELQTAWPARSGMIVNPNGVRLEQNQPISVNALQGWRVLTPDGKSGDLQLQLKNNRAVWLPIAGEVSIASHLPLIQAMLAQGDPDSQVDLSLVVSGSESPRLEIRRYHDTTVVEKDIFRMGLMRDTFQTPQTVLDPCLNEARRAMVRAVNLKDSDLVVGPIETNASVNLARYLVQSRGPWLIQSTLEGRVQRAEVWGSQSALKLTREKRIGNYARDWQKLSTEPQNPDWGRMWQLISTVGEDGDIGVLDQVQALAKVPVAAIALAFRVPPDELSEVFALETAAPIFWPALKIADFSMAVQTEHLRQCQKLAQHFDDAKAVAKVADLVLVQRIGDLLHLRLYLKGHVGVALQEAGLFKRLAEWESLETCEPLSDLLRVSSQTDNLVEAAQEAAKRFDRLPQGIGGLKPNERPRELPEFDSDVQTMIDAPLVVAEMATGRRPAPDIEEKLILINLRFVDPLYFDAALPAAIVFYRSCDN